MIGDVYLVALGCQLNLAGLNAITSPSNETLGAQAQTASTMKVVHIVRRQNIWRNCLLELAEGRPPWLFDIRRRAHRITRLLTCPLLGRGFGVFDV